MPIKDILQRMVSGYRLINSLKYSIAERPAPLILLGSAAHKINERPVTIPVQATQPHPVTMSTRAVQSQPIAIPIKIQSPEEDLERNMAEKGFIPKQRAAVSLESWGIPLYSAKLNVGGGEEQEFDRTRLQLNYTLIPKRPGKDDRVYASAKIFWDEKNNHYEYELKEPEFTEKLKEVTLKVKNLLEQKLDVDFTKLKRFEAVGYLHKKVDDILGYYSFGLTKYEKDTMHYYMERDFIGIGKIEALMQDDNIEDISCDGIGIPIFIFHRNPKIGSVPTNITFESKEELDSFIMRMSQLCGKSLSVASPLVDGALPDGSRLQATLATDIARRGSNFTIRKFSQEPLTPVNLLSNNTIDVQQLAFLWLAVDYGRSVLVSGGTASGKTSLLNVLSLFIRPERKIISIEDTPELKLPHTHWIPTVARVPISMGREVGGVSAIGEIDLFDLLKESVRQRPDYTIVGEVRGKEAYVLFQQMATGHPSLATIHAENELKLVDRLTTPPIELPAGLLANLDLIVFLMRGRYRDKHVRRVNEILEIIGVDPKTQKPITNQIFRWDPIRDKFEISNSSVTLKKIGDMNGLSEKQILYDLLRRMYVLHWMSRHNVTSYIDVFTVFSMYYAYPEKVLNMILAEIEATGEAGEA
jgi:flagellar protein FlaI